MKKSFNICLLIAIVISSSLGGCPTCIGRLEKNSPPFFSEEFEKFYRHEEKAAQELSAAEKTHPMHEEQS